jgi:hypothetical protein
MEKELWMDRDTGRVYEWLMSAIMEDSKTVVVVYQDVVDGIRWVRPSREFYSYFERKE